MISYRIYIYCNLVINFFYINNKFIVSVNCQDGSAQIVSDPTGSAQIVSDPTGSAQIVGDPTGSAQIVTSDNNSTIDSQTFTYIPLRDLLSLDAENLTSPCASASEFRNYIENIDRWT